MKYFGILIILLLTTNVHAKNVNISIKTDLNLNCKFEKVIIKNSEYNFETFTSDQIYIDDIKHLIFKAREPDILKVKNLSKFLNEIDLEVKISNKDIILIKAFDNNRNYSESAVYTRTSGEFIHEITKKINSSNKEKEIYFYNCDKII